MTSALCFVLLFSLLVAASAASASPVPPPAYDILRPCYRGTYELSKAKPDQYVEPCVIADVGPVAPAASSLDLPGSAEVDPEPDDGAPNDNGTTTSDGRGSEGGRGSRSAVVTLVQVTPTKCGKNRDGAILAVEVLNADNGGSGVAVGFGDDPTYVKFRLVSVIAGNAAQLGAEDYRTNHESILESMLKELSPQYIVGTCSFVARYEKDLALKYKTILMAQVGPPSFYEQTSDPPSNNYIFGIHVNSNTYPLPAMRQLTFHARGAEQVRSVSPSLGVPKESATSAVSSADASGDEEGTEMGFAQPIRILGRSKAEFHFSTCRSARDEAVRSGFNDTIFTVYDPAADDDGDGVPNEKDAALLRSLVDEVCPPLDKQKQNYHPAIFLCTRTEFELDTIIGRLRENACRPNLLWTTHTANEWAYNRRREVHYMQGGGQWHASMRYADEYFPSGQAMLDRAEKVFGYKPAYGLVGAYTIPYVFYKHLQSYFRVTDSPEVMTAFDTQYEELRRAMVVLFAPTVYGPVSFDANQRNAGRGAAGMQWLPLGSSSAVTPWAAVADEEERGGGADGSGGDFDGFILACVSPLDQAEAPNVVPAPASVRCPAGSFVNASLVASEENILGSKCSLCSENTFTASPNERLQCDVCPEGSISEEGSGSTKCVRIEDNLLPTGFVAFGYALMGINWVLSLGFAGWSLRFRKDPVVRFGQLEFLLLICAGAFISGSAVIPLSFQAGAFEDTTSATIACQAGPFLYTIGWVMQYSSISAKSYRMYRICHDTSNRRTKLTFFSMLKVVVAALLADMIVVVTWTLVDPLQWVRTETGKTVNEAADMVTIESVGRCTSNNIMLWVGPLLGIHLALLLVTNFILYKIRDINERYQERKYVAMASVFAFEIFVVGTPIIVAVNDSNEAFYIASVAIVAFSDIGILCLVFIPKMLFQREGLPEGVSPVQSIMPNRRSTTFNTAISEKARELSVSDRRFSMDSSNWDNQRRYSTESFGDDRHPPHCETCTCRRKSVVIQADAGAGEKILSNEKNMPSVKEEFKDEDYDYKPNNTDNA